MDRQGMDATRELGRKNLVDHAMTFDPALPAERLSYDMDSEMTFAARPVSGMAFVAVRFVLDVEALRRQGGGELFGDPVFDLHETVGKGAAGPGQPGEREAPHPASIAPSLGKTFCQD